MAFGVQSIDRQTLKNNVVALAKAAKVFNIPTTITSVETQSFSSYTYPEAAGSALLGDVVVVRGDGDGAPLLELCFDEAVLLLHLGHSVRAKRQAHRGLQAVG